MGMRLTDENVSCVASTGLLQIVRHGSGTVGRKAVHPRVRRIRKAAKPCWKSTVNIPRRAAGHKTQRQFKLHNGQMWALEITDSFIELHGNPLLLFSLFRDVTTHGIGGAVAPVQKMEAIGQLAGGVATTSTNILTVD